MEEYVLLETNDIVNNQVPIKGIREIIELYLTNPDNYADPIMCKQEHLIGKIFIPESSGTLFWVDLMNKKYFFDLQAGNV